MSQPIILGNVAHWCYCVVYADSQLLKYSLRSGTIYFCASSTQQMTSEDIRYMKVESPLAFIQRWRQLFAFYKYLIIFHGFWHFLRIFNLLATEVLLSRPVSLPMGSWLSLLKRFALFFFLKPYSADCMMSFFFLQIEWIY